MRIEERLGREIANHWDRSYDDSVEGQMPKEMARWLLENYDIHRKLVFD